MDEYSHTVVGKTNISHNLLEYAAVSIRTVKSNNNQFYEIKKINL